MGHFKNEHVINFKIEKEPKMELFDFWAFQNFMQMLSHDKIIFHMLFGAFHITPRIYFLIQIVSHILKRDQGELEPFKEPWITYW